MSDEWVSVKDAAQLAGVGLRTMRRWVASGKVDTRLAQQGHREIRLVRRDSLRLLRGAATSGAITVDHGGDHWPDHSGEHSVNLVTAADLAAIRTATERQAAAVEAHTDLLRDLLTTTRRQEQEIAGLRQALEAKAAPAAPPAPEPIPKRRPWWRRWGR